MRSCGGGSAITPAAIVCALIRQATGLALVKKVLLGATTITFNNNGLVREGAQEANAICVRCCVSVRSLL
jgi:hypothetical protein